MLQCPLVLQVSDAATATSTSGLLSQALDVFMRLVCEISRLGSEKSLLRWGTPYSPRSADELGKIPLPKRSQRGPTVLPRAPFVVIRCVLLYLRDSWNPPWVNKDSDLSEFLGIPTYKDFLILQKKDSASGNLRRRRQERQRVSKA